MPAYAAASFVAHSRASFEQFTLANVKRLMRRLKTMFGLLLAAFWLAATGHCCPDPLDLCAGSDGTTSMATAPQGKGAPAPGNCCSFEQSARSWNRRPSVHSGLDEIPSFLTASDWDLPGYVPANVLITLSDSPSGLAKSWQFLWRTALEPRAPSRVS